MEAQTSSLNHSPLLPEWCSDSQEDLSFGSLGDFLTTPLAGKNILFVSLQADPDSVTLQKKLDKINALLLSKLPARIVLVGPPSLFSNLGSRETLELALIPHSFIVKTHLGHEPVTYPISITLAINKVSMWMDPIDWSALKNGLQQWSNTNSLELKFNLTTDARFRERSTPPHLPRTRVAGGAQTSNLYHFTSPTPTHKEETDEMLMKGVPLHIANLISKANRHPPLLSILGILPNQLRNILKLTTPRFDEAFEDISSTLIGHSYQIWKMRVSKIDKYWKKVAQSEWKPYTPEKKRKSIIDQEKEKSRSPFHFLIRQRNFSTQRRTPCPCSHEITVAIKIFELF